jgi:hypothetical protein
MRVKEEGEFVCAEVPIPRQRVCDIIPLPLEPLTITLDVRVHENRRVFSCCVDASRRLLGVVGRFDEVGFLHPAFCHRAVRHAEGAVPRD